MEKKLTHLLHFFSSHRLGSLAALYLTLHLPSLTKLPVFADEAIYIRWAQLIQDDAARYLFFPMLDGKPPLFMWLLSIVLYIFEDPLFAGRLLSIGIGLISVYVMYHVTKEITNNNMTALVAGVIVTITPFWFFLHRMALMDGLLSLLLLSSFYGAVKLSRSSLEGKSVRKVAPWILLTAFSYAGALMTKTPALFAIPAIATAPLFYMVTKQLRYEVKLSVLIKTFGLVALAGIVALFLFLLLRISPLFGSLFSRSTDFTYTIHEVIHGEWSTILGKNLPLYFSWWLAYLTPVSLIVLSAGVINRSSRKTVLLLLLCAAFVVGPFAALGKVIYPRYFLPLAVFVTPALAIGFTSLTAMRRYRMFTPFITGLFLLTCARFIFFSLLDPAAVPFVAADQIQYLSEWSAGYGNPEMREFVLKRLAAIQQTPDKKIIVLTEGSFGTLPDGLLMYFHAPQYRENVEIHGIGVGPSTIPVHYTSLASSNEVYYIANSHRFKLLNPQKQVELLFSVPRPYNGPSLMVYKVLPNL